MFLVESPTHAWRCQKGYTEGKGGGRKRKGGGGFGTVMPSMQEEKEREGEKSPECPRSSHTSQHMWFFFLPLHNPTLPTYRHNKECVHRGGAGNGVWGIKKSSEILISRLSFFSFVCWRLAWENLHISWPTFLPPPLPRIFTFFSCQRHAFSHIP